MKVSICKMAIEMDVDLEAIARKVDILEDKVCELLRAKAAERPAALTLYREVLDGRKFP